MTVKLEFNTDFTYFLENNKFNDPVEVITESGTIKCNAALLVQHSPVLREFIKEDNQLFLTDNSHVRECLSILYGGSVELIEESFQDILKFMVAFDIPGARKQILDWMSKNRWNLDNVGLLINSSIVAAKAFGGKTPAKTTSIESLKEEVYKPSRVFIGQHLVPLIHSDSTDTRYQDLEGAMECVISEVEDKKELLAILLHQDLIPNYIPWVKMIIDQSSYNIFINSLDRPEISTVMCLCPRAQFEGLFEKMEEFENITLQEYKRLNRYKMNINEKITVLQSLKFMKENGSLYFCWKILEADGMSVLSTGFTDKSDQFCVIECLLSWLTANKPSFDMEFVETFVSQAISHFSKGPKNMNLQSYYSAYVQPVLSNLSPIFQNTYRQIPNDNSNLYVQLTEVVFEDSEIVLKCNATIHPEQTKSKFTIKLFQNKIPEVFCDKPIGNHQTYVYAWKVDQAYNQNHTLVSKTTRVPLYCDPDEAYKTLKTFKFCEGWRLVQYSRQGYGHNNDGPQNYIHISIIWVGV